LEDKEGGDGEKNVKGGVFVRGSRISIPDSEDGTVIDATDERGFVDGVKVARKCSKANVLGKVVEYMRVLKKRENRLKAEQAGLKTLVAGLVGGPALLKEWEREWKQRFGREEKDEVEGDDVEGDDEESDDEDGDEGDEELGRKRKRPKFPGVAKKAVAERKTSTPATGGDSGVPEKRKRGRPRKVVPPPATAATDPSPLPPLPQTQPLNAQDQTMPASQEQWMQVHQQQQQSQPQQYLLAVFALFSFFNSPLTSSSSHASGHHQHAGTVLTSLHPSTCLCPRDYIPVRRSLLVARRFRCRCLGMEGIRTDVPSLCVYRRFGEFCSQLGGHHAGDWEDDEKSQCFIYASECWCEETDGRGGG
jgi:hypothetical protein